MPGGGFTVLSVFAALQVLSPETLSGVLRARSLLQRLVDNRLRSICLLAISLRNLMQPGDSDGTFSNLSLDLVLPLGARIGLAIAAACPAIPLGFRYD